MIEKETVLEIQYRLSNYFSVVQDHDIKLYRNIYDLHTGLKTDCFCSKDGIDFRKEKTLFKNNSLSHNFYVFIHNGIYYGLGGTDNWKHSKEWHSIKNFNEFKKKFEDKFNEPYQGNEGRFKTAMNRLITTKHKLPYSNGLYLFKSANGIDFEPVQHEPVITINSDGFNHSLSWKSSEFDSMACVIHDGVKFILYLRNNVEPGSRHIQYSTSPDLINWSTFENIEIPFKTDDNYYFGNFWYDDTKGYQGLLPFYNDEISCIKYVESEDGVSWSIKEDFFVDKPAYYLKKPKNKCQPVSGVVKENGKTYVYIHHNYYGLDLNEPVLIKRYEL